MPSQRFSNVHRRILPDVVSQADRCHLFAHSDSSDCDSYILQAIHNAQIEHADNIEQRLLLESQRLLACGGFRI